MTTDRPRFLDLIAQLHQPGLRLSPVQQQHLEFFDAMKAEQAGKGTEAARLFIGILERGIDPLITARARAALVALYLLDHNYVKAYTLANELMAEIPRITDQRIQLVALNAIVRVLISEKRYAQAAQYARQIEARALTGNDRCTGRVFRTQAEIYGGGTLAQLRTEFQQTLDLCRANNLLGYANGLRLDWASLMIDEDHSRQAISYLHEITPDIVKSGFQPHIASLHVTLAQAYLKEGKYELARQAALAGVAASDPKRFSTILQYAYEALYQIAKHDRNAPLALDMYEKYVAQFKATADDAKAQAMAYQIVRQDVLTNRMRLDELGKQNKILQLRQSLDKKSAETSRLYILILLFVLVSIALWAYRIKHSQMRFRKMARHDDLTGVFNRQYFFEQAENTLHRLQKDEGHACLLILDMDHFKRINDEYGHVSGDSVLEHVSRVCIRELRDSDVCGRLGGEEFGILMPGCTSPQGMEIGERIRRVLAQAPARIDDHTTITVTASIGLASTEVSGYALKPLIIAADEALYAAKRGGRNRLVIHTGHVAQAAS